MKIIFLLCLVLVLPMVFTTCSEEKLSKEEQVTNLLVSGIWKPSNNSITLQGIDVTADLFSGFTISFTKNKIVTTGTTPVWPREDGWQFKPGSNAGVIVRGIDSKEITIHEISANQLKISFEWDKTTYGGRVKSLPGLYEFILTR